MFSLRMSQAALLLVCTLGVTAVGVAQQSRPAEFDSTPVVIESASVPLNPQDDSQTAVGDFHYAGGISIGCP